MHDAGPLQPMLVTAGGERFRVSRLGESVHTYMHIYIYMYMYMHHSSRI